MSFFRRKTRAPEPAPAPKKDEMVSFSASDDLLTRAEKIVYVMGYRGAVGGVVIAVYRLLQVYERLDRSAQIVAAAKQRDKKNDGQCHPPE